MDRHHGTRYAAVEFVFPGGVSAETDRQTLGDNLEDAAQRVSIDLGLVDELYHFGLNMIIRAIERRIERDITYRFPGLKQRHDLNLAKLDHVTFYLDAKCREKLFCNGATGYAGGCLASGGPF